MLKQAKHSPAFIGGVSPWDSRGEWIYSIVKLQAEHYPLKAKAFAEMIDHQGNHRGRDIGSFHSESLAMQRVNNLKNKSNV